MTLFWCYIFFIRNLFLATFHISIAQYILYYDVYYVYYEYYEYYVYYEYHVYYCDVSNNFYFLFYNATKFIQIIWQLVLPITSNALVKPPLLEGASTYKCKYNFLPKIIIAAMRNLHNAKFWSLEFFRKSCHNGK